MTVSSTNSRNDYTASGACTFNYTFEVTAAASLDVYLCGTLQTSGYTVSGVGTTTGGTVTFTSTPAVGSSVVLIRDEAFTQDLDLVNHGPFDADSLEDSLDLGTFIDQQLLEQIGRAPKFAIFSCNANITLDDVTGCGGMVLSVAADETHLEWVSVSQAQAAATGSFTAGGTGAVSRTVSSKLADWPTVSVKDFGATGNGVTDDTATIRAAITAVAALGGGTVLFPVGSYVVNPTTNGVIGTAWNFSPTGGNLYSAIAITADDITLLGADGNAVILMAASSTGTRANAAISILGTAGTPVQRTTIRGLTFNIQNQASGLALYAQQSCALLFVQNRTYNFANGIDAVTLDNTRNATIEANHWRDGQIGTGLYEASNITIAANSFYNVNEALDADKPVTAGTGTAGHNISVVGNTYDRDTVDTVGDAAFEFNGYTDVSITGNTIRNSNNGIHLTAKPRNGTNYPMARTVVANNTIQGVNGVGIAFGDIADNTFVNHTDMTVSGNMVSASGGNGIQVRGTRVVVKGNQVRTAGARGIEGTLVGSGNDLTDFVIADNLVTNCVNEGIRVVTGTRGTITGNTVSSNLTTSGTAQIFCDTGTDVLLTGNLTSGTGTGISSTVTNCTTFTTANLGDVINPNLLKALVVFDGTNLSPITPSYSFNIKDNRVTRIGATGDYCVTFTRAFSCARYAVHGTARNTTAANGAQVSLHTMNATCMRVLVFTAAGAAVDADVVSLSFYGTQA